MSKHEEIREKISSILSMLGISSAPIPVHDVAVHLGIRIVEVQFSPDVSGALIMSDDQPPIVAVNQAHHINRQRFTIAHELGHYILKHKPFLTDNQRSHVDWEFTVLRRDTRSSSASDWMEILANQFAAELLMPESLIRQDVFEELDAHHQLTELHVAKMAKRYKVSQTALHYRLINLGFLNPA